MKKNYLFIFISILLFSCKPFYYSKVSKEGISSFEIAYIGGMKQAIHIRGKNADNPVLLYLHGGPGFPVFPFLSENYTFRRLEKFFTIVYWEQRGTGKSFSMEIPDSTMNIEQFIEDIRQVVEYVTKKTGKEKVFIWGHSWGSNIGAIYAARHPQKIHAYISTGQSVNPLENERLCYEFILDKATQKDNKRALSQIAQIDTTIKGYSLNHALTVRKWLYRYGGIVKNTDYERQYIDLEEISAILTAPEYNIIEKINLMKHPYYSAEMLWEELKSINLFVDAPKIEVPVYFLVGKHDIIVSHKLAEQYFEILEAPKGKTLIWFEESAHRPFIEERKKFIDVMVNVILKDNWDISE